MVAVSDTACIDSAVAITDDAVCRMPTPAASQGALIDASVNCPDAIVKSRTVSPPADVDVPA
jgi:hypothetical protein